MRTERANGGQVIYITRNTTMRNLLLHCIVIPLALVNLATAAEPAKPVKALLIAGGCCHDYAKQKELLKAGIEARANVVVDIVYNEDRSTKAEFSVYAKENWAAG